jgi:YidC/Oxa1 family membrane protein insertase
MTTMTKTSSILAALGLAWACLFAPLAHAESSGENPAARAGDATFETLRTEHFEARVSTRTAGLASLTLSDPQFVIDGAPLDMVTTSVPRYFPLAPRIEGAKLPESLGFRSERLEDGGLRLSAEGDGLRITRKLEAGKGAYQLWLTTTLENASSSPRKLRLIETTHHYVRREDESGGVPFLGSHSPALSHGLCRHAEELEREDSSNLLTPHAWKDGVRFTAIENVYFVNALASAGGAGTSCRIQSEDRYAKGESEADGSLFASELAHPEITLAPGEKRTLRALAYIGPKTPEELSRAGHALSETINSGFFATLAHALTALMTAIHGFVGNWGIAIIFLTLIVKLALYPLTHKQMESMAKMKELKPEMDKINELYADDREKKGAAIMELYRKRGVNPMAGCFPVLLQLPIWFSLYASLSSNIRLFHAPFALWWQDLSSPDPYFVLPLSLGVLMFVQQKMAPPAGADPLQQKMMLYMMPTMITAFMLFLPAGLCLYMFTNSALSIVQQRVIEARLAHRVTATSSTTSSSTEVATHADESAREGSSPNTAQRRLRRGRK